MNHLNPEKLHVNFMGGAKANGPISPRAYTLTHSDMSGELFLTISQKYHYPQISGFYTRLMRDEVLAKWEMDEQVFLHVHCHVSGGLVFGPSGWRYKIFRSHLPMVLEAFYYGDRILLSLYPRLAKGEIIVHFHAREKKFNQNESWGMLERYC
ncbi:MAG: staygreen family protein [Anaerolineales bacterium]